MRLAAAGGAAQPTLCTALHATSQAQHALLPHCAHHKQMANKKVRSCSIPGLGARGAGAPNVLQLRSPLHGTARDCQPPTPRRAELRTGALGREVSLQRKCDVAGRRALRARRATPPSLASITPAHVKSLCHRHTPPQVYVIYYSTYGHVKTLAEAIKGARGPCCWL